MKERPMLFSAPMVRALLDGAKTQTRRLVAGASIPMGAHSPERRSSSWTWMMGAGPSAYAVGDRACPYGVPGDRLWVRETWAPVLDYVDARHSDKLAAGVVYRATYDGSHGAGFRWRPSIHMPRWASRILLEITNVRAERLQDISEEDARAEGVAECGGFMCTRGCWENYASDGPSWGTARESFASLWDSTSSVPWASNPWVWVIEFEPRDHVEHRGHP